jgi:hypothetical protein
MWIFPLTIGFRIKRTRTSWTLEFRVTVIL